MTPAASFSSLDRSSPSQVAVPPRTREDDNGDVSSPARIVVAVSGGPESDLLVRRAADLARAESSELLVVHVLAKDGGPGARPVAIAALRRHVEEIGATFHTVLGTDVATAVRDFATGANARSVVLGVSRHRRPRDGVAPRIAVRVALLAEDLDVRVVAVGNTPRRGVDSRRQRSLPLGRARAGWVLAVVGPAVLTGILLGLDLGAGLSFEVLLFLALTVAVALTGGLSPAVVSALVGFLTLNYFFTPPTGRLIVADPQNLLTLAIFVLVAVAVASVVDLAARRRIQAFRASAEASALAEISRSVATGEDTAGALVSRLRETFSLAGVSLLERRHDTGTWHPIADAGTASPTPADAETTIEIDKDRVLALHGRVLPASDRRVLETYAAQAGLMLEHQRLQQQAEQARVLEHAEATRTALLAAVSHDLRTPLATVRAAIDVLLSDEVDLTDEDTSALVRTVATATARLERLIDNLLDLSRLQTGSVRPALRPTSLDEIVPVATEGFDADTVIVDVPDTLPLVRTDPGLLERAVANVISNAVHHSGGTAVRISATATRHDIELRVIDSGPGLSDDRKAHMFEPFQRLGDASPDGLGLGLAVTEGLATAVGAEITVEDTPGGGLTMVLTIPLAQPETT